jgi:hypothetical protein
MHVSTESMVLPYATLISISMALRKQVINIKSTGTMIQRIQIINKKLKFEVKASPLRLTSF